jgi:transposase
VEECEGLGMKAIPVAMRERILKLYDQGKSTVEIAAGCGYCVAAVRRVRQHFKVRGTVEPQTHLCGRKTLLTAQRKTRLQKLVADQPDATLAELGTRLDRPFGTSTVDLWLRRLGLSYKKNAARRRAAPARRGRTQGTLARTTGGGTRRPARVRG